MSTVAIQPYTSNCKIITTVCHESQNGVVIGIYPLVDLMEEEEASSNFSSCRVKCISRDTSKVERVESITKGKNGDLLMLTPQMLEIVVKDVSFPKVAFAYIREAHFVSEFCRFSPVYYRITKLLEKIGTSCILALSTVASIHTARMVANILGISGDNIMYKPPAIPRDLRLTTLKEVDVKALTQWLRQPDLKDRKVILYCSSTKSGKEIIEQLSDEDDTHKGRKRTKSSHGKSKKRKVTSSGELACYFPNTSSAEKKNIREEFAEGKKKVIITPLATGGMLKGANAIIHCSVPQSYESLLQGSTVESMTHIYIPMDKVPEAACGSLDVPKRHNLKKFLRSLFKMQQQGSSTVEFKVADHSGIKVKSVQAILCIMESENVIELLSPITVYPGGICKIMVTASEEKLETLCDSIYERMTSLAGARMEILKQLYEDIRLVSDDEASTQELFVTKLTEQFTMDMKLPAISLSNPSTAAETPKSKEVAHTHPSPSLMSSTPSTAAPNVSSAQSTRKRCKESTEAMQEDELGPTTSKRSRQYKNKVMRQKLGLEALQLDARKGKTREPASYSTVAVAIRRGDKPKLPDLKKFTGKIGQFNILERIGTKYKDFGTFLLQDNDGSKVDAVEQKWQRDSHCICEEIVKQWLQGRGKQPVVYATLVACLEDAGLNELAKDIESILQ